MAVDLALDDALEEGFLIGRKGLLCLFLLRRMVPTGTSRGRLSENLPLG